jgi:hypothetical protein
MSAHRPRKEKLIEFAAERLSDFKVPRKIFIVEEIPKGATGKLFRVGLAEKLMKSPDHPQTCQKQNTPRTHAVRKGTCWDLGRGIAPGAGGAQDNFFYLGGDSILATLVVSRVRRVLHLELPLINFFEKPTVAEMALSLETTGQAAPARNLQLSSRFSEIEKYHFLMTGAHVVH